MAGSPDSEECAHNLATFVSLCLTLGVPLAQDKQEGQVTTGVMNQWTGTVDYWNSGLLD